MADLRRTAKTLIKALNTRNYRLTFAQKEFVGAEDKVHTYYSVNQASWNKDKHRFDHSELYGSTSLTRIVLYLRDMWYLENKWDLPMDQEKWNTIRESLKKKGTLKYGKHR